MYKVKIKHTANYLFNVNTNWSIYLFISERNRFSRLGVSLMWSSWLCLSLWLADIHKTSPSKYSFTCGVKSRAQIFKCCGLWVVTAFEATGQDPVLNENHCPMHMNSFWKQKSQQHFVLTSVCCYHLFSYGLSQNMFILLPTCDDTLTVADVYNHTSVTGLVTFFFGGVPIVALLVIVSYCRRHELKRLAGRISGRSVSHTAHVSVVRRTLRLVFVTHPYQASGYVTS